MRTKFAPTTIWALQAAIAIILALLIGHLFHLERSYWAVLSALLLVSQTWGESIKKSLERVGMTILGGIVGTLLYFSMSHEPVILFFAIIIVTFFIVYFLGYSFLASAFFITIFVVFLFAMIGSWDLHVLEVRIYETMIGAAAAILVSIAIFPTHSNFNLITSFKDHLQQTSDVINLGFDVMNNIADPCSINQVRDQLYTHFRALLTTYTTSSYEMFFMLIPRKKARILLNEFAVLLHYVTSFLEASSSISIENFSPEIQQQFQQARDVLCSNLEKIIELIEHKHTVESLQPMKPLLDQLNEILITTLRNDLTTQSYILQTLSAVYYLKKINETLLAIETQLEKI